jgi:hypothetical protein
MGNLETDDEHKGHTTSLTSTDRKRNAQARIDAFFTVSKNTRFLLGLMRRLELNWPLSLALMLLGFIIIYLLKSG